MCLIFDLKQKFFSFDKSFNNFKQTLRIQYLAQKMTLFSKKSNIVPKKYK